MALILDGNGLIQGLDAGGLPSGSVNADTLASTLDLSSKTMTFGNVSASGITFPATQSASSDANTLDDYEEGTWTPSVGGNATYNAQSGDYTKIGRMVFFRGVIVVNTIGTGSTTTVSGLPFSVGNGGVFVDYWGTLNTNVVFLSGDPSGTTVVFYSATAAAAVLSTNSIFKNGTQVNFAGLYRV
jgi:hypothetical protein